MAFVQRTIVQGLVRALFVIVLDVLANQIVEVILSERDEVVEAFALDGSDLAFDEAVQIGRSDRQAKNDDVYMWGWRPEHFLLIWVKVFPKQPNQPRC